MSNEPFISNLPAEFANFIPFDQNKVFIRPDMVQFFEKMGLTTLDAFFQLNDGKFYKRNFEREVLKITLENATNYFIKRHFKGNFNDTFYSLRQGRFPISTARLELEAIAKLEYLGIFTLQPIAFGEETLSPLGLPGRSFLITQEVTGIKLEDYLRNPSCEFYHNFQLRYRLTTELANIARTLHENNLHHQDFYLGHLLLNWITEDDFTITLIDLQRVRFRNPLDRRWCVKDLAQLYYSISQIPYITLSDRMRFFRSYLKNAISSSLELQKCQCVECRYHPNILCSEPPCNDCRQSRPLPPSHNKDDIGVWLNQIQKKYSHIAHHDRKLQARKAKNKANILKECESL